MGRAFPVFRQGSMAWIREHDFLGEREIPADAYYGIQTCRALDNFNVTGQAIGSVPELIRALARVKKAAALANMRLGVLPEDVGRAIGAACDEIVAGRLHDQFPVDWAGRVPPPK